MGPIGIIAILMNLAELVKHYKEISDRGEFTPEDKVKAKLILEGYRFKTATEIEKERGLDAP